MGVFATYQPVYADHGIATFPLNDNKRPAVKGWNKIGQRASREFASKFTDANALGFVTNHKNGLTVLDVDSTDEQVLADALTRHGETPMIVRTASGKSHAYYRHNGERRRIRPWDGLPIDVLGTGGLVVAPPTVVTKGGYEFIQGGLDDITRLPVMRDLDASFYVATGRAEQELVLPDDVLASDNTPLARDGSIAEGARNDTLWRFCMSHAAAHRIKTGTTIGRDALIEVAHKCNADCSPPVSDTEVIAIAASAWGYDARGDNWFGTGRRVVASHDEIDQLSPDAFYLLSVLRRHHWGREFIVANAMADTLGWSRKRFAAARAELGSLGKITLLRPANQWQGAALYRWPREGQN